MVYQTRLSSVGSNLFRSAKSKVGTVVCMYSYYIIKGISLLFYMELLKPSRRTYPALQGKFVDGAIESAARPRIIIGGYWIHTT